MTDSRQNLVMISSHSQSSTLSSQSSKLSSFESTVSGALRAVPEKKKFTLLRPMELSM